MRTVRLRLPSPALIVACLALFAAVGGGAYAASSSGGHSLHFTKATLKNGWKRAACRCYAAPGYARDSTGEVHLRGVIYKGPAGTDAFILPKALRPSHFVLIEIFTQGGAPGYLQIEKGGAVAPFGTEASGFTSLDGVSFAAGE